MSNSLVFLFLSHPVKFQISFIVLLLWWFPETFGEDFSLFVPSSTRTKSWEGSSGLFLLPVWGIHCSRRDLAPLCLQISRVDPWRPWRAYVSVKMVAVRMVLGETGYWLHFKSPSTGTPVTIHSPFPVLVVLECFSSEGGYLLGSSPCMSVSASEREAQESIYL